MPEATISFVLQRKLRPTIAADSPEARGMIEFGTVLLLRAEDYERRAWPPALSGNNPAISNPSGPGEAAKKKDRPKAASLFHEKLLKLMLYGKSEGFALRGHIQLKEVKTGCQFRCFDAEQIVASLCIHEEVADGSALKIADLNGRFCLMAKIETKTDVVMGRIGIKLNIVRSIGNFFYSNADYRDGRYGCICADHIAGAVAGDEGNGELSVLGEDYRIRILLCGALSVAEVPAEGGSTRAVVAEFIDVRCRKGIVGEGSCGNINGINAELVAGAYTQALVAVGDSNGDVTGTADGDGAGRISG